MMPSSDTSLPTTRATVIVANSFTDAINDLIEIFKTHAIKVNRGRWQGIDISSKPDMATYELTYVHMDVNLGIRELGVYRSEIAPNLPWADDHFEERVGGDPLNPGVQWRKWPWGHSADKFRLDPVEVGDVGTEPVFDHTYMQRYWPRFAGRFAGGILPSNPIASPVSPHSGIYFEYGDLDSVALELGHDPYTRQAILPVFFPEDTGYRPGRRKPCSLFYQFQVTDGRLDVVYQIRSCDIVRHFRDDIYLTVRLLLWVINKAAERNSIFTNMRPGRFIMDIANLHCFANDWRTL